MDTIRAAFADGATSPSTVVLRAPEPGDLGWVVARHGVLYAAEYGWDMSFEGLVADIVAGFATEHDPGREGGWIAELAGRARDRSSASRPARPAWRHCVR